MLMFVIVLLVVDANWEQPFVMALPENDYYSQLKKNQCQNHSKSPL